MLEELQRRNCRAHHDLDGSPRGRAICPSLQVFDRLNPSHFRTYQAYLLCERKMRPLTVRLHVAAPRFFFVKTLKRRYLLHDTPHP
jgi:hypothetical protein